MEISERFEELSAAEMAALRKEKQSDLTMLIAINGMLMVVGAAMMWRRSPVTLIAFVLLIPLLLLFIFQHKVRSVLALSRDIRDGRKLIMVDRVGSQRQNIQQTGPDHSAASYVVDGTSTMSYSYLINVQGRELRVSEYQYYKCKPGQLVEVHLAPNSNHLFFFDVLKESAPEANSQAASV